MLLRSTTLEARALDVLLTINQCFEVQGNTMSRRSNSGSPLNDSLRDSSLLELSEIISEADAISTPLPAKRRSARLGCRGRRSTERRDESSPLIGRRLIKTKRTCDGPENEPSITPSRKRVATGRTGVSEVPPAADQIQDSPLPELQKITSIASTASNFSSEIAELSASEEETKVPASEGPCEDFFGLPASVKQLIQKYRGITKLYDWQRDCLNHSAIRDGKSLVISLPTSGGKTLVAELLILKKLLIEKLDAVFVLPFVSIVQEKIKAFTPLGLELGFIVEEYAGGRGRIPPIRHRRKQALYIATIERASSLLSSLLEMGILSQRVGLVVVDELHMIGESMRGVTLEQMLTKVKMGHPTCQIVGLSATLPNTRELAEFLGGSVFEQGYRPVSLTERVKVGDKIYKVPREKGKDLEFERSLDAHFKSAISDPDPDRLTDLVLEVVPEGSCLVFCPSKKNAENVAKLLAKSLFRQMSKLAVPEKKELLAVLTRECDDRVCPLLQRCIPSGVAYHHSGLTAHERGIVQDAYLEGTLKVICCTSTLAAGVNLPAKRVIIRSPLVGTQVMSRAQYKQMSGRAGRAGLDTEGESILMIPDGQVTRYSPLLLQGALDAASSRLLENDNAGVKSLVLSAVTLNLVTEGSQLKVLSERTLLGTQKGDVSTHFQNALDYLINKGLIRQSCEANGSVNSSKTAETTENPPENPKFSLKISKLGRAVTKASFDIELVERIHGDLSKASDFLMLNGYLHLLYIVVPYDQLESISIDMRAFEQRYTALTQQERKLTEVLGIHPAQVEREVAFQGATGAAKRAIRRLGLAFILRDLWSQRPLWDVALDYGLPRGTVQNLLQGAASFAGSLVRFCEELEEFWALRKLLPDFARQLTYCIHSELLPLMELQGVRHARARQLYSCGYKTVASVAQADARQLVATLSPPGVSRSQAQAIIRSAKMLLQERMEALLEEAELLMGRGMLESRPPQ